MNKFEITCTTGITPQVTFSWLVVISKITAEANFIVHVLIFQQMLVLLRNRTRVLL